MRFFFRPQDHSLAGSAIHDDAQRRVETQEPDAAIFAQRRLLFQPLPIDRAFAGIRVYGEVADLERGKVLKKMAALRRRNAKIAKSGFDDGARP